MKKIMMAALAVLVSGAAVMAQPAAIPEASPPQRVDTMIWPGVASPCSGTGAEGEKCYEFSISDYNYFELSLEEVVRRFETAGCKVGSTTVSAVPLGYAFMYYYGVWYVSPAGSEARHYVREFGSEPEADAGMAAAVKELEGTGYTLLSTPWIVPYGDGNGGAVWKVQLDYIKNAS